MKTCTKILMSAVMGLSLSTAAFAQQAGSSTPAQTGGSDPAAGAGVQGGNSGASAAMPDAQGNVEPMQSHDMTKMGTEADMKMGDQLDKIASMPDKAGDALFAFANANGNLFEIEFAKLAQSKSENAKVKELAMMIEKDHTEANQKLKPIVEKMGLEFPTALSSEKMKMLKIFSALSAKDFDTCYVLDNKAVHAKDITSFTDHQKSVKDDELKAYIAAVLPKLKEHGMHVGQLSADMGYPMMGGMGGKMDHGMGGMDHGEKGDKPGGSHGAETDPTAPANNQNPSNR